MVRKRFRLQVVSADPEQTLKDLTDAGMILEDVVYPQALTARFTVEAADPQQLLEYLEKKGVTGQIIKGQSVAALFYALKQRLVLALAVCLLLIATWYLPTRVFFVTVHADSPALTQQVSYMAQEAGLTFGCKRSGLPTQDLKDHLLSQIPQLSWVGITTTGCVATIQTVQGPQVTDTAPAQGTLTHLIAATDGVIESMTVTGGTALCAPGQVVRKDQILISGYEDCGLFVRAVQAEGEIIAQTQRNFQAVIPLEHLQKQGFVKKTEKISLILGKKQINFYKGSGISPMECVKMYERKYLTLPGGFQLPVAWVKQVCVYYDYRIDTTTQQPETARFCDRYLLQHTLGCEILQSRYRCQEHGGVMQLFSSYICREQIGKYKQEEILNTYG